MTGWEVPWGIFPSQPRRIRAASGRHAGKRARVGARRRWGAHVDGVNARVHDHEFHLHVLYVCCL